MNATGDIVMPDRLQSLGSLETRVLRSGTGTCGTVLALHSLGLDAHAFDALRVALDGGWQVVSFDQRGHGAAALQPAAQLDAYVADARAALSLCGDGPVHLLGHSMGGAVAALLAAEFAHESAYGTTPRIASLALLASPAQGVPGFVQRADEVRQAGMDASVATTLARWFGDGAGWDGVARPYAERALRAMTADGMAAAWEALAAFDGYATLVRLLPPTLCIAADDDLSTPPAVMQRIVNAFTAADRADDVRLTSLGQGGHMVPLLHAVAVAAPLQAFWQTHGQAY